MEPIEGTFLALARQGSAMKSLIEADEAGGLVPPDYQVPRRRVIPALTCRPLE